MVYYYGEIQIPKFNFVRTKLDYNNSGKFWTEWNAYFDWGALRKLLHTEIGTISLQTKIFKTNQNNQLEEI